MGKVLVGCNTITYNDRYSFRNFVNQDLSHFEDLQNITIYSSQFYWETPNSNPFPSSARNLTFVKCDLSNIIVPEDSILIDCKTDTFENQNDGEDWKVNCEGVPIEPVQKALYIKLGLSVDPADLPESPSKDSVINKALNEDNQ